MSRKAAALAHMGALEGLDNLTFVINCNLQRLDGPVRGNGKIIQELESFFRGAGWNVIKVVWGREWDALLHADRDGALVNLMNTTPDGDYQTYKANDGGYVRDHFFGRDPRTKQLVKNLSDPDLEPQARRPRLPQGVRRLPRRDRPQGPADGDPGQDHQGLHAGRALRGPQRHPSDEKAALEDLKGFRDVMQIPISMTQLDETRCRPTIHPGPEAPRSEYMLERRRALGGFLPEREPAGPTLTLPGREAYKAAQEGSGKQQVATTMAFVRASRNCCATRRWDRIVPIIPDEARTFGMDSWFPTLKIYTRTGSSTRGRRAADAGVQGANGGSCCTRASTRPARWRRSPRSARRTRPTTSR